MNEEKDRLELKIITPSENCMNFIESGDGIYFAAMTNRDNHPCLTSETYSLAKWIKQNNPSIKINIEPCEKHISLRSNEYWIPLVYLANNIALPLFINALYDYLKSRITGALSKEANKVHVKITYKKKDDYKEIQYDGPIEGLTKLKDLL